MLLHKLSTKWISSILTLVQVQCLLYVGITVFLKLRLITIQLPSDSCIADKKKTVPARNLKKIFFILLAVICDKSRWSYTKVLIQYICIALFCPITKAVRNTEVFSKAGGLSTLIRNILDTQLLRINESVTLTVLHLLNHPSTRRFIRFQADLEVS